MLLVRKGHMGKFHRSVLFTPMQPLKVHQIPDIHKCFGIPNSLVIFSHGIRRLKSLILLYTLPETTKMFVNYCKPRSYSTAYYNTNVQWCRWCSRKQQLVITFYEWRTRSLYTCICLEQMSKKVRTYFSRTQTYHHLFNDSIKRINPKHLKPL